MKENMDDGEIELSDQILLPNSNSSTNIQPSVDSFLDDLLRNSQTCTHTHTCNPPGPNASHTHTCHHTHTQVIPSDHEDNGPYSKESPVLKTRRPLGNREAVKKYREKKKAHATYLEEEVKKLRFVNQRLMMKLQKQTILENEISRLRGILVGIRGKVDNELGDFPFGRKCDGFNIFKEGECGLQPTNDIGNCGKMKNTWDVDCPANTNYVESGEKRLQDSLEYLVPSAAQEE